jgi:iron complex transport system substrate-binding protein
MAGTMRTGDGWWKAGRRRLAGLAVVLAAAGPVFAATPARVVSVNLCTDQLAMEIAAPGQLLSVSLFARDPLLSSLSAEAMALPVNHASAEEVAAYAPDLVLAGTFTARTTVSLLTRLGYRVEEFPPAYSLGDIRDAVMRMGDLLGQPDRARVLLTAFDRRIAAFAAERPEAGDEPVAVVYHVGNTTDGRGTLADAILSAAGWRNLAADLGLSAYGSLPLERLVMERPDLVLVGGSEAATASRALPNARHPAILALTHGGERLDVLPDRSLICGTPFVTETIAALVERRQKIADEEGRR